MVHSFMLIVWIAGNAITTIPTRFDTGKSCRAAGESFVKQGGSGYACIDVPVLEDEGKR